MSSSGAGYLTAASLLASPVITTPTVNSPNIAGVIGSGGAAPTIASATTIAPTTEISYVSGITTIQTITPPSPIDTKGGTIAIIPTGIFLTGLLGNIALASTSVVNKTLNFTYDPVSLKWTPSY